VDPLHAAVIADPVKELVPVEVRKMPVSINNSFDGKIILFR
jgi:hypothetical protein